MKTYNTEERSSIYLRCIETYGAKAQVDMAIEEMSELIKALLKYRRATDMQKPTAREDIIDELADVKVMTKQLEMIFNAEKETQDRIDYKVSRQIQRLEQKEARKV